ncbi:MAG: hypothetical protein GT589_04845 [Peptoclostridium sp.]|uniref:hypothetical protein n=1 Tax=Peptoclostridium sp. TaxID=1904860 RepID=UPI00139B6CDE|nr:hypothetical protein [Peptoclostridium sp.]MZQ75471.1 hypothetical protein [Peptoclostridium sp.]
MDKIKDIIYEYSDTVLGLIIVFVMVAVIGWQLYNWFEPSEGFKSASDKTAVATSSADDSQKEDSSEDATSKETSSEDTSDNEEKHVSEEVTFQIKQGSSCEQIAIALEQTGLIDSKEDFLEQIISKQLENKLKTGTYTLKKGESLDGIIAVLTK